MVYNCCSAYCGWHVFPGLPKSGWDWGGLKRNGTNGLSSPIAMRSLSFSFLNMPSRRNPTDCDVTLRDSICYQLELGLRCSAWVTVKGASHAGMVDVPMLQMLRGLALCYFPGHKVLVGWPWAKLGSASILHPFRSLQIPSGPFRSLQLSWKLLKPPSMNVHICDLGTFDNFKIL